MQKLSNRTNKCDIQQEISLSEEVKKYPCLYNRTSVEYKDEDACMKSWKAIEEVLGLPEGDGLRRFENLKKRYSKKRNDVKRAARLGTSAELAMAKRELEIYSFFFWLDPYIRARCPKIGHAVQEEDDDEKPVIILDTRSLSTAGPDENNVSRSDLAYDCEMSHSPPTRFYYTDNRLVDRSHRNLTSPVLNVQTDSRHDVRVVASVPTVQRPQESVTIVSPSQHPAKMKKGIDSSGLRDPDDLFGEVVAAELKAFPIRVRFLVKHEINEVIFKYQMREFGDEDVDSQSSSELLLQSPSHLSHPTSSAKTGQLISGSKANLKRTYCSEVESS